MFRCNLIQTLVGLDATSSDFNRVGCNFIRLRSVKCNLIQTMVGLAATSSDSIGLDVTSFRLNWVRGNLMGRMLCGGGCYATVTLQSKLSEDVGAIHCIVKIQLDLAWRASRPLRASRTVLVTFPRRRISIQRRTSSFIERGDLVACWAVRCHGRFRSDRLRPCGAL